MNNFRLRIITTLIVVIVLSLVIVNCVESPFGPKLDSFQFPLAVDNFWEYDITKEHTFYDTSGAQASVDTMTGRGSTTIGGAVSIPEIPTPYSFITTWELDQYDSGEQEGFCHNQADGFYVTISSGAWTGPPKLVPGQPYYEFKGIKANSLNELSDYFYNSHRQITAFKPNVQLDSEDRPVRNWAYPLEVGTEWLYRDTLEGDLFDIQKSVIGTERVTVSAGKFNCYKMKWQWDIDKDGVWDSDIAGYDYLSEIGTARRVFIMRGLAHRDYDHHVIGTLDIIEDYSLTAYDVK